MRNLVWDARHGYATLTPCNDIDLIFYDTVHTTKAYEASLAAHLSRIVEVPWDVWNHAALHHRHHHPVPVRCCAERR